MSAPVPPHQVGRRPPEPEQRGPGGSPVAQDKEALSSDPERLGSGCRASQRGKKKKKKYNRHTKPPYTYLAMIALVIQASPDRKLKLSQIIREISTLFPFFNEGYQGWKDSIRHNLSSNDCFRKVLKDPGKPRAKGNFWTVDVERIPPEALKLQNTPVSRQGKVFAGDLAPYVYHGWTLGGGGGGGSGAPHNHRAATAPEGSGCLAGDGMRQASPFSIDSLLSDFQDVGLCGKARPEAGPNGMDAWGPVPIYSLSSGGPLPPWRPPRQLPALHSFSSSGSLSSLSSSSPCGREDGGPPRLKKGATGAHTLAKRARVLQEAESSSSDSEGGAPPFGAPAPSAPHWEQLPTSYTKSVAPNVVAPASCLSPFSVLPAVTGLPFGAVPYANPVCWEMMPRPPLGPAPPSGLSAALDLVMPPNKTVFDVWASHPVDSSLCSDLAKTCASLDSIVGGHYATS